MPFGIPKGPRRWVGGEPQTTIPLKAFLPPSGTCPCCPQRGPQRDLPGEPSLSSMTAASPSTKADSGGSRDPAVGLPPRSGRRAVMEPLGLLEVLGLARLPRMRRSSHQRPDDRPPLPGCRGRGLSGADPVCLVRTAKGCGAQRCSSNTELFFSGIIGMTPSQESGRVWAPGPARRAQGNWCVI